MKYEYENADQFYMAEYDGTTWSVKGGKYATFEEMDSAMNKHGLRYRQYQENGTPCYENIALAWFLKHGLSGDDISEVYHGDIEDAWSFGLRHASYPFTGFEADPNWNSDDFRKAVDGVKSLISQNMA